MLYLQDSIVMINVNKKCQVVSRLFSLALLFRLLLRYAREPVDKDSGERVEDDVDPDDA